MASPPPRHTWDPKDQTLHLNLHRGHISLTIWLTVSITSAILITLVGVVCYYIKQRRQRHHNQQQQQGPIISATPPEIVAALPRKIYLGPDEDDTERLDCSICLAEFHDEEELREVPGCGHLFHAECIGTHLRYRRECPYCRGAVSTEPSV